MSKQYHSGLTAPVPRDWFNESCAALVAAANEKKKTQTSEKELQEASLRSHALSTTSDSTGVSFRGRAFQSMYIKQRFTRRAELVFTVLQSILSSSKSGGEWSEAKTILNSELTAHGSHKNELVVCSIGGGPGTDAAGIVAANNAFLGFAPTFVPTDTKPSNHGDRNQIIPKITGSRVSKFVQSKVLTRQQKAELEIVLAATAAENTKAKKSSRPAVSKCKQSEKHHQRGANEGGWVDGERNPRLRVALFDKEPQWRAYTSTLSTIFGASNCALSFDTCDVYQSITTGMPKDEEYERSANDALLGMIPSTDLFLFSFVVNETSAASKEGNWKFYRDLAQQCKINAVMIFMDVSRNSIAAIADVCRSMEVVCAEAKNRQVKIISFPSGAFGCEVVIAQVRNRQQSD
jgi:hypothetical protein